MGGCDQAALLLHTTASARLIELWLCGRTSLAQQDNPSLKRLEIGALKKEGQHDVTLGLIVFCHHLVRSFRLTTDF